VVASKIARDLNLLMHAEAIHNLIQVIADTTPLNLKYGEGSSQPVPIVFRVIIPEDKWGEFQDLGKLPGNPQIATGTLVGLTLPQGPGAQKGVHLSWNYGGLDAHGQFDCTEPCSDRLTDEFGTVSVTFTPKVEKEPIGQTLMVRSGSVTGSLDIHRTYGNGDWLGPLIYSVRTPIPYTISWHLPNGPLLEMDGKITVNGSMGQSLSNAGFALQDATSADMTLTYSFLQSDTPEIIQTDTTTDYQFHGTFTVSLSGNSLVEGWVQSGYACMSGIGTLTEDMSKIYTVGKSLSVAGTVEIQLMNGFNVATVTPRLDASIEPFEGPWINSAEFEASCGPHGGGANRYTQSYVVSFLQQFTVPDASKLSDITIDILQENGLLGLSPPVPIIPANASHTVTIRLNQDQVQ
jgi:hypothetical protein